MFIFIQNSTLFPDELTLTWFDTLMWPSWIQFGFESHCGAVCFRMLANHCVSVTVLNGTN